MVNQDCKLHTAECRCLSWKPVFAGALMAIGLSFLLHLFSVAIGLTTFGIDNQGAESLVLGGLVATAFGTIVVMFASGWMAGYLGNRACNKRHLGALYGFLTWVVALIALMFIVDNILHYVTVYSHSISGVSGMPVSLEKAENTMGQNAVHSTVVSSYIVFILFFLSAFSASLGGHCGMRHVCKNEMEPGK